MSTLKIPALRCRLLILFIATNVSTAILFAQEGTNDHIFPASAKAKPFIDFDSKGFLLKGKRTFLVSAGMEYARVPHELWYDRLLRLKRDGFNCIEIYTFWNFHEPQDGKFNFSGDHDLDAFLKLVNKMGMYVIARVGPYYCAEWDNGGYPLWLRFKPGVRVREDNPAFEKYTDRFLDTLMPIVCRNQINRGGSVIMVQLENEHTAGWGTYMPNGYFRHLRKKSLSLGLEVPYFFSGLHHASDPAVDGKLDDPARPNPWFSTEFWSVWFTGYSSTTKDAREYERRTWRIIANGGNGYNYYMAYGGSNFAYSNNDEDAASYDYGAAVGQAGDLRPIYYSFKRCALFARSFQDILENSTDATAMYRDWIADSSVHISARKSAAGDIIFLDNPSATPIVTRMVNRDGMKLPSTDKFTLQPGEIFPIVHHFKITNAVTLEWAPVKILGLSRQGSTTTIIIYGEPGSMAELYFSHLGKISLVKADTAFLVKPNEISLQTKITDATKPAEYSFTTGKEKIRILVMSTVLADRTWFIEAAGKPYIACGPDYAGETTMQNGHLTITTESPLGQPDKFPVWTYGALQAKQLSAEKNKDTQGKIQLPLAAWQMKNAYTEAAPGYNDQHWKKSDIPLQMGADGDNSADAWYRTMIDIGSTGTYTLYVEGSDRAIGFIDGKPAGSGDIKEGALTFNLSKGKHTLAVFTAHDGRDKLAGYMGNIDSADRKGIFGKVMLVKGGPSIFNLTNWRFLKASRLEEGNGQPPSQDNTGWQDYTIGKDAFDGKEGFGWFQTTLPEAPAETVETILNFKSVDENATVFINGIKQIRHAGWNIPFSVAINHPGTLKKPIVLTVFMENYSNEGGIDKPVHAINLLPSLPLTVWRMRGGAGNMAKTDGWIPASAVNIEAAPHFFRSSFVLPANTATGDHMTWRVVSKGLGHGSVWVNGHNLGRYPEKIPINGLYIPECWMKPGANTLIIYDEDGKYPAAVSIAAEMAASRQVMIFTDLKR